MHQRLLGGSVAQRRSAVHCNDAPVSQYRDPVRQALRFIQVMRAQHDAATGVLEADDQLANRAGCKWIEAGRWLVKENDWWFVQEGARECDLLLHPA